MRSLTLCGPAVPLQRDSWHSAAPLYPYNAIPDTLRPRCTPTTRFLTPSGGTRALGQDPWQAASLRSLILSLIQSHLDHESDNQSQATKQEHGSAINHLRDITGKAIRPHKK